MADDEDLDTDDENPDDQDDEEGGQAVDIDPDESDVEEQPDGSAIVKVGEDEGESEGDSDFYVNLASTLPEAKLDTIASELIDLIETDKREREEADKRQAKAMQRTGLTDDNGEAAFDGASTATHPMLAKAYVDYQARTIHELFPATGPVKDFIPGEPTSERVEKAERKVKWMNWQCRVQMPGFRNQVEKLLGQQIIGGSQYLRLVYDSRRKKPVPTFIPADKVFVPYAAGDFYSAERRTYAEDITQFEFERRIRSGEFRAIPIIHNVTQDAKTDSQKKSDRAEGKDENPNNDDGLRTIYWCETYTDAEEIGDSDRPKVPGDNQPVNADDLPDSPDPKPYIIAIDAASKKIVAMVRNWEEEDKNCSELCWIIEWPFIPWRGSSSVGLAQLIGSLAGATTGALRALLDSALVNNLATLVKLKGANTSGQTIDLSYGKITEIEGAIGGENDIRKLMMAVPWNPPSMALFQLLGLMTEYGEQVVQTTFENAAEASPNMPVGTTLALIEQGMKVLSAIHLRLHGAMDRVIQVLHRIDRMYLSDEQIVDDTGEHLALHSDFQGPLDVVPVSDPEVFSDIQRFAQMQVVAQRAADPIAGQLYDRRKVELMVLQRTKIPDAEDLLLPAPQIEETNFVNENVVASLGRPIQAFPDQDHLAHLQGHLDYMKSPFFGSSPLIAPKFLSPMLQHISEHMVYWYLNAMMQTVNQAAEVDITHAMKNPDPEVKKDIDKTLAAASPGVVDTQAPQKFAQIPAIIQQAQQMLQQFAQAAAAQAGNDPVVKAAQITATSKQASDQAKGAQTQQTNQAKAAQSASEQATQEKIASLQQQGDDARTAAELQTRTTINQDDNATALEIAAGKIATGHAPGVTNGTGVEGHAAPES